MAHEGTRIGRAAAIASCAATALLLPAVAQAQPSDVYGYGADELQIGPPSFGDQQNHDV